MDDIQSRISELEKAVEKLTSERVIQSDMSPASVKPRHLVNTGTPKNGDLPYSDGTNFVSLAPGSTGSLLNIASGVPAWLAPGTVNQILTMIGGAPVWQAPAAATVSLTNQTGPMSGGNYTLTTTMTDLTGTSITLAAAGTYLVLANVGLDESAPGTGSPATIQLVVNGSANTQTLSAFDNNTSIGDFSITVAGAWIVTTGGTNQIIKLQANKAFNTGTYSVTAAQTVLNSVKIA